MTAILDRDALTAHLTAHPTNNDGVVGSQVRPLAAGDPRGAVPNPNLRDPGVRQAVGISAAVIGGSFILILLGFVIATYWWAIFPIMAVAAGLVVACARVLGRDEGRRHCAQLVARCDREMWG